MGPLFSPDDTGLPRHRLPDSAELSCFSPDLKSKIVDFYAKARSQATEGEIAITPRQTNAIIKIAIARARFLLKDMVEEEDVERAIEIVIKSYAQFGFDPTTGKVDFGVLEGHSHVDKKLLAVFEDIFKSCRPSEYEKDVNIRNLVSEMAKTRHWEDEFVARNYINELLMKGNLTATGENHVRRTNE